MAATATGNSLENPAAIRRVFHLGSTKSFHEALADREGIRNSYAWLCILGIKRNNAVKTGFYRLHGASWWLMLRGSRWG
jgi:hypothetical protein